MAQLDAIERHARGPVQRVHLDCQHSPPTERPTETIEAIVEFLAGLPDAPRIVEEPLDGPGATTLLPAYLAEIHALYPDWTPDVPPRLTAEDVEPPNGRWLIAYQGSKPIGSAALKRLDDDTAEVKRVYVAPEARGTGVARALLARLEEVARTAGYSRLRLDTGPRQPASVALLHSSGYKPIADYNANAVAAFWFEKRLA
jgi:GNAT superfamily N-acetyltransferase